MGFARGQGDGGGCAEGAEEETGWAAEEGESGRHCGRAIGGFRGAGGDVLVLEVWREVF